MKNPIPFALIFIGWLYAGYIGLSIFATVFTTLAMFIGFAFLRVIYNSIAFNYIIKYTGVDELDFLKQNTQSQQAKILTIKLAEKTCLLNYRTLRAIEKLKEIEYLSAEECENQKNALIADIEKTTSDYIVIPKTNPRLLEDLSLFAPELFMEFKIITAEQKLLRYMIGTLMPRIFNYEPR